MNTESGKTLMYVAVAAVMALAGMKLAPSGPRATQDGSGELVGKEFYENFKNPAEATSIEVVGYDPATATPKPFSVEFSDGLWRIPTRYSYPADAKDRLAKVAASIIGLKREALAGKSESEQAEFQVLDPKGEKTEILKGIGNRVTLRNGNTVLADYIIGKQVPGQTGLYYVRKPDEKQTYKAKVDLNLSTKFTDWIESDVLNLEGTRLTLIDILKHTLEIGRRGEAKLVGEDHNILKRKNSTDPWTLEGLDEATEEVNQDEVRKVVSALDDLKIVGVRPKPETLRRDLRGNEGIKLDQNTAEDLADRGFFILRSPRGGVQMVSKEGDLTAGTDQGVEYEMHFGTVFEGTEEEIEFEFAKKKEEKEEGDKPADAEKKEEPASESKPGTKKSRFIYVTARVNPELFGSEPEEPIKPEPPEDKPADEKSDAPKSDDAEKKSDDKPDAEKKDTEKKDDEKAAEEKSDEKSADEEKKEAPEPPKQDPKQVYEEALKKFEADKVKYEIDVKSRDGKLKEAAEKVKALNARFADWYYVISAESFENLRPGRDKLVKAKPDAEKKPESDEEMKDEGKDGEEEKPSSPEKSDDEKREEKKPESEKPKSEKSETEKPEK